ncbi:MAG: hypothetical protein LBH41_00470, partial [Rickettsiales bacterium]|nr:hypothetical protein [Rickettsiales bacterium]
MERGKGYWRETAAGDKKEFIYESPLLSFVAIYRANRIAAVLDQTNDEYSPDYLLIVAPRKGEDPANPSTKWDAILREDFAIDPAAVRPKEDTKYRKMDVAYESLDLYAAFAALQSEEIYEELVENRLVMSMMAAQRRESLDLLDVNTAKLTITRAESTAEILQKRSDNLSKRIAKMPDSSAKTEAFARLYEITAKLKRAERRKKRAQKRLESAERDLASRRLQIAKLQALISGKNAKNQTVITSPSDKKTDMLTIENPGAMNRGGKEKAFKGETIMATKDTKTNNTEFKPPYVDDTAPTGEIRFAQRSALDDKGKKIWAYAASVFVSLALVFGVFYLLSGDKSPDESEFVEA